MGSGNHIPLALLDKTSSTYHRNDATLNSTSLTKKQVHSVQLRSIQHDHYEQAHCKQAYANQHCYNQSRKEPAGKTHAFWQSSTQVGGLFFKSGFCSENCKSINLVTSGIFWPLKCVRRQAECVYATYLRVVQWGGHHSAPLICQTGMPTTVAPSYAYHGSHLLCFWEHLSFYYYD